MTRNFISRAFCLFLTVVLLFSLAACVQDEKPPCAEALGIYHSSKFGGIEAAITIDDFNALGFSTGDSVDITFSNGAQLKDVPYYNGYYIRTGEPVICAYPGYNLLYICFYNGKDLYDALQLDGSTTVTLTMNTPGKYLDIQTLFSTEYSTSRGDYSSDEVFANYRCVSAGNIKNGLVYRSASPADNRYKRAAYTNALIRNDGIAFILDLADSEADFQYYLSSADFESEYAASLYEKGCIALLDMSMSYSSLGFKQSLARGLREMLTHDGPYLIHCTEGINRTGFVLMLLEALCGAQYDEILADYMLSYANYYGITAADTPSQYESVIKVRFNDMLLYLTGVDTPEEAAQTDMREKAAEYLMSAGMAQDEIEALTKLLCE